MSPSHEPSKKSLIIGISYNQQVGGGTVKALEDVLVKIIGLQTSNIIKLDYRKIVPESSGDIESIYTDHKKLERVFSQAKKQAKIFLEGVDGLVIPGNDKNIDPRLYGEQITPEQKKEIDLERAIAEMALLYVAGERGIPILGICGGHQLLNVYLGGKLKDLSIKKPQYDYIHIINDSNLASTINKKNGKDLKRESFFGAHKQTVIEIGGKKGINGIDDYLRISAIAADRKQNIEATESLYGAPVISVQFHPEIGAVGLRGGLFDEYVEEDTPEGIKKNVDIIKAFTESAETYNKKMQTISEIHLTRIQEEDKSNENTTAKEKSHDIQEKFSSIENNFSDIDALRSYRTLFNTLESSKVLDTDDTKIIKKSIDNKINKSKK